MVRKQHVCSEKRENARVEDDGWGGRLGMWSDGIRLEERVGRNDMKVALKRLRLNLSLGLSLLSICWGDAVMFS